VNPLLLVGILALVLWPRRRHNPSRRSGPTQRERWLADAVRAGYQNDGRLWVRTLAEARVNRAALQEAYRRGAAYREAERRNPWTPACMLPGCGHVFDFTRGGRCQCCGRLAPKRTVELEWRGGERTRYGSTCAARSVGTTRLRTNQLEHMERQAAAERAQAERYRGVKRERIGRLTGGVDRPPWAAGLTNEQLIRIAREHGQRATDEGWWSRAHLTSGSGELQRLLREGTYRHEKTRKGGAEHATGRTRRAGTRAQEARIARASATGAHDLPW
jgi:hypothetical protein